MPQQLVKTPIYQQLNEALRDLIRQGEFAVNDQFLTERQICQRFNVSRATANKALSNLVAEGILKFKKGIGTFVCGGVLDYDLRALVSFTDKAHAAGKTASTQVLTLKTLSAGDAGWTIAETLWATPTDRLYYIERLRLADNIPVIFDRRYVVERFCPNLSEAELAGSLFTYWVEECNLNISGADQTIQAVSILGTEANLMQVNHGAAGLLVSSVGYLSGERPLWSEHTIYRGNAYAFSNRLGPIKTARPAAGSLLDF